MHYQCAPVHVWAADACVGKSACVEVWSNCTLELAVCMLQTCGLEFEISVYCPKHDSLLLFLIRHILFSPSGFVLHVCDRFTWQSAFHDLESHPIVPSDHPNVPTIWPSSPTHVSLDGAPFGSSSTVTPRPFLFWDYLLSSLDLTTECECLSRLATFRAKGRQHKSQS